MAAGGDYPSPELPLLLLHYPPSLLEIPFKDLLLKHYRLLNPGDHEAHSVTALLCIANAAVNADILHRLPSLKLVVGTSAGFDHIDLDECRRRAIAVTNASSAFAEDVADYAVGLLLDALRRISAADQFVRGGLWRVKGSYPLATKVGGKRVGIVGLGAIGSMVARRIRAFGCHIAYNSRKLNPSAPYPFYASVCELAANSDALVVCCSLSEETRHIINADVMRALGKEGFIVNVGRGALVDEAALVKALVRGEIGGAGLDVFEHEPAVPNELCELDNVVLSPHRAAYTPEGFAALAKLVMGNLEAFFSNKPLLTEIK